MPQPISIALSAQNSLLFGRTRKSSVRFLTRTTPASRARRGRASRACRRPRAGSASSARRSRRSKREQRNTPIAPVCSHWLTKRLCACASSGSPSSPRNSSRRIDLPKPKPSQGRSPMRSERVLPQREARIVGECLGDRGVGREIAARPLHRRRRRTAPSGRPAAAPAPPPSARRARAAARASAMPPASPPRRNRRRSATQIIRFSVSRAPPSASARTRRRRASEHRQPRAESRRGGAPAAAAAAAATSTRQVENAPTPPWRRAEAVSGAAPPSSDRVRWRAREHGAHADRRQHQRAQAPSRSARRRRRSRQSAEPPADLGAEFRLRVRRMDRPEQRGGRPADHADERPAGRRPAAGNGLAVGKDARPASATARR